jgi:hypothetical protein
MVEIMFIYIKSITSGEIVGVQFSSTERPFVDAGYVLVPIDYPNAGSITVDTHYVNESGLVVAYSPALAATRLLRPSPRHQWDVQQGWIDQSTLLEAKADKLEEINIERERRGILPITFESIQWDADELSQRNISAWMASIASGVQIPTGFTWRAYDNTDHPADADFINGLGNAITLRGTLLYQTSWGKKAEVNLLTTVTAVKAYDVTANW